MQEKEGQSGSDPGSDNNDPPFIQVKLFLKLFMVFDVTLKGQRIMN